MPFVEPTLLCGGQHPSSCAAGSLCCVLFEAPTLPALGEQLIAFLQRYPQSAPLTFSHAHQTRWEPRASLAGPAASSLYTGLLLLRMHAPGHRASEIPSPAEQVPGGGEDLNVQIEQFLQRKDRDETTLLS
jgi:hypothetical protein